MTNDEARRYFKDKGLTYNDVTLSDLHYLKELLNEQFTKQRKAEIAKYGRPLYWSRVNDAKYYKGEFTPATEGYQRMICAYLTGKGEYFSAREVISFNRDGFIGFCGDASTENTAPVLAAFIEWCDWLATRGGVEE